MIAAHIHDALDQVRKLQAFVLERNQFKGYSGKAHLASGLIALLGAAILNNPRVPATTAAHLIGWSIILATALVLHHEFDLLFGACLSLYGLAQVAYRRSLPHPIYLLGLYYLACGAVFLLAPGIRFTNPWPMAIAFSTGEFASGLVLISDQRRHHTEEQNP